MEACRVIAVLIRAGCGGHRWIERDVVALIVLIPLLHQTEILISVTRLYHRFESECSFGSGRAGGREGRCLDKGIVLRRHGDILAGNGEGIVRRGGRVGERHIIRSPLLEGNCLAAVTFLGVGRDAHRVVLKEASAALWIGDDIGAGECAVLDLHRIRRAGAVGGEAAGLIHIDCVGGGVNARVDGKKRRAPRTDTIFLPLDRHPADLFQGQSSHRVNAIAVHIYTIPGIGRIDGDLAGGVDGHIGFRPNAENHAASCVVLSVGGDCYLCILFNGDILCVDAVASSVCGICFGNDFHIGIALDRHISVCTGAIEIVDSDSTTAIIGYIDRERAFAAAVCGDGDVATATG